MVHHDLVASNKFKLTIKSKLIREIEYTDI